MALSTARPTPLRLVGFVCMAGSGLLIGLGSVATWANVTIGVARSVGSGPAGAPPGGLGSSLPPIPTKGTDTIEGKIALACAVLILVAIPVMRLVGRRMRPAIAVFVALAGALAGGLALRDLMSKDSRLGTAGAEQIARTISAQTHLPYADVVRVAESHLATVNVQWWIYAVILGGVIAVVGGILSLLWARSESLPDEPAAAADAGPPELAT